MQLTGEKRYSEIPAEDDEGKPSIRHWIAQIDCAKRAAKTSLDEAEEAWEEYLSRGEGKERTEITKNRSRYPAYWSSVKTIQPALYSRTPITTPKKVFDDLDDNQGRLGTICLRRLAQYLIRACPFDETQMASRDDYIHAGKATTRVFFESYISTEKKRTYYTQVQTQTEQGPMFSWIDKEGQPTPDGRMPTLQDEEGYYVETEEENLQDVCAKVVPVSFRDILHTPNARNSEEITWIAYRERLTSEEIRERFFPSGDESDLFDRINFSPLTNRKDEEKDQQSSPLLYATVWEIWDKKKKRIYWYAEGCEEFLDVKEDYYKLQGFFPSPPFMVGTVGPSSLYPVPDYTQLRPFILQMHSLADRFRRLVKSSRRRGVADAEVSELNDMTSDTDDGEFIMVKNFGTQIVGKGGLDSIVQFFPVDKIVESIQQIGTVQSEYENKFYELYGIPDILRGVSDPRETAAAQQLKGSFLSLRFSAVQRRFQQLVRDGIELMCDLALRQFPEEKLKSIMGFSKMKPEDQQIFPQVLLILKDDNERFIRIDIETDSTITMNQNAEVERSNTLTQAIFAGFAAVAKATQENPMFTIPALETFVFAVSKIEGSEDIEQTLRGILDEAKQPKPPAAPPPPDPAMVKAQMEMQVMQRKAQAEMQIAMFKAKNEAQMQIMKYQNESYLEQRRSAQEMDLERLDAQHQMRLKQSEAQLAQFKAELEASLEMKKTQAEMQMNFMESSQPAPEQQGDVNVTIG